MDVIPVDLTALAGILVGGIFITIPILGFTARFALKPIVDAVARMREGQYSSQSMDLLEQRVTLIEQQIQNIDTNLERLLEKKEFDRQLTGGPES